MNVLKLEKGQYFTLRYLDHLDMLILASRSHLDGFGYRTCRHVSTAGATQICREVGIVGLEMSLEVISASVGFVAHSALKRSYA